MIALLAALLVVNVYYFHRADRQLRRDQVRMEYFFAGKRLLTAESDAERFAPVTEAAHLAFLMGETNKAAEYARESLALAPQFTNSWNYGNAIHDGHMVLGKVALGLGDIEEATEQLIQAGGSTGSPQLNSFGPDMGLARLLLQRGQRDAVVKYMRKCQRFWRQGYLQQWIDELEAGKKPDLSSHCFYE
jgi:hypothetical protein